MAFFQDFEAVVKSHFLDALDESPERPRFLEIGANDGRTNGIVYPYLQKGWKGAFVEPVPYLFERLQASVAPYPNAVALPYACGQERGRRTFYSVDPTQEREKYGWIEFIGSFDREVIMRHRWGYPDLERHIREIEVESYTATELAGLAGLDRVDCLVIDAEGYDDIVLTSFDLGRFSPSLITIEHRHIRGQRHEEIIRHCRTHGYRAFVLNWDTIFLSPDMARRTDVRLLDRLISGLSQYAVP